MQRKLISSIRIQSLAPLLPLLYHKLKLEASFLGCLILQEAQAFLLLKNSKNS